MVPRILGLGSGIIVARILGKEGFGEFGIIQSTLGMFGIFAGFSAGVTATKYIAEFRNKDRQRAGQILSLCIIVAILTGFLMTIVLMILGPWLCSYTLAAPHLKGALRLSALTLLLGAVTGCETGILAGFEAFKSIARINVITGVLSFPIMIACVYLGGLYGAFLGLIVINLIGLLLNHLALHAEIKGSGMSMGFKDCYKEWPILLKFSLPTVLSTLVVVPINWACTAMLVNQPNGYAEMGIFNAANQWFMALLLLPIVMGQTVLPILSERLAVGDKVSCTKILSFSIKINSFVIMPLVLIGCVTSQFIMRFYGTSFADSWPTLIVVLLTGGLLAIQTPVGHIIAASGRMWIGWLMNSGWALVFLGLNTILIKEGALGLALARGGAYAIHAIWTFAYAYLVIQKSKGNFLNNV